MMYKQPKNWQVVSLDKLVNYILDYRGKTPKKSKTGIPTLSAKSVKNNYIDYSEVYYISSEEYSNFMRKGLPNVGDVLLTVEAPLGLSTLLDRDDVGLGQRIVTINGKNNVLENRYLKFYLQSPYGQHELQSRATGTTVTGISQKNLRKINIILPSYEEQEMIANLLSSFDDKIENNNAIIANLEEQAQAIFKSWFVDFEPFQEEEFVDSELGAIPKDWKVKYLLDLIEFKGGSQPPKKEHIYEYEDGYVRFIQNRDYNGQNNHITYIKESKKNRYADRYDILMDKYGEAGKTRYGIEGAYNVALAKIEPNNISLREYIRRFLEQDSVQDYIYNSSMASTRPSVNKKSLSSIKLVIPPKDILKKFDDFSFTIIESILKYQDMNKKLAEIRDTLLPKLMSGEIRVEEAIEVEEM